MVAVNPQLLPSSSLFSLIDLSLTTLQSLINSNVGYIDKSISHTSNLSLDELVARCNVVSHDVTRPLIQLCSKLEEMKALACESFLNPSDIKKRDDYRSFVTKSSQRSMKSLLKIKAWTLL
ncbi:hypothetical protein GEMRC1_001505 [Eukaryota sp. GEM-RC1]